MGRHRIRTDAELHAAATARGLRHYHRKKARLAGEPVPEPEPPSLSEPPAPIAVPPDYDPVEVLKQLSLDPRASGARVLACKILIDLAGAGATSVEGERVPVVDRITAKAVELMRARATH
jgi:hypothetical protein